MLHLAPLENKVTEIRVEYIGRLFFDPCSSSPTERMCVCVGGGRIGAPDDLRDVNTSFKDLKHFKLSITFLFAGLILV